MNTFQEFVSEFETIRRQFTWQVTEETGGIRAIKTSRSFGPTNKEETTEKTWCNDEISYCPITALCFCKTGKFYKASEYPYAASELNIDPILANQVVEASDNPEPLDSWTVAKTNNLSKIRGYLLSITDHRI